MDTRFAFKQNSIHLINSHISLNPQRLLQHFSFTAAEAESKQACQQYQEELLEKQNQHWILFFFPQIMRSKLLLYCRCMYRDKGYRFSQQSMFLPAITRKRCKAPQDSTKQTSPEIETAQSTALPEVIDLILVDAS